MPEQKIVLPSGKKLYFISDLHLGAPDIHQSKIRELKIIAWLDEIKMDAEHIFFVGDIFDFWMEYSYVVPKGFIRFLGKLASLRDEGIKISFFTGNHDMWMQDYFPQELDIPIIREPIVFLCGDKKFMVGHGDGLGPGDHFYKFLKILFNSKLCLWLFKRMHPNFGMGVAGLWSAKSRASKKESKEIFKGDQEWLWQYCKAENEKEYHDYYIFGHRHLPLDLPVGDKARYINLGEWVSQCHYGVFDGQDFSLIAYEN